MTDFIARMNARGERVEERLNETVQAVAFAVVRQVVAASPVDTGLFCANWVASVDTPNSAVRPAFALGSQGSTGAANKAEAIRQAESVIASRKPGQDIWICNNVDYGRDLNAGSSRQAPANFVELGIQSGLAELRQASVLE